MPISSSNRWTANDGRPIGFRPVTAEDLAMLEEWMSGPHWREWWGDTETELGYIRDMIEGRDGTRPFIFTLDGEPAGYIQYWSVGEFQRDSGKENWTEDSPWLAALPAEAIGIDVSIAREEDLGKGIGTCALRAFAAELWAEGHRNIIIDPDRRNVRAIRAYEKAGFVAMGGPENLSPKVCIMQYEPNEKGT